MSTTPTQGEKSFGTVAPTDVGVVALPTIELSASDVRAAIELAQNRSRSYRRIDGGELFGSDDPHSRHKIGLLGELAVAKAYQASIDSSTYRYGDDGTDLVLWGQQVDVKTTATRKLRLPELLVRADTDLVADLYVLAHLLSVDSSEANVRLIGYAPRDVVLDREPVRHPGQSHNYVVDPAELSLPPWLQTDD